MDQDFKMKILVCVDCKEEFAFTISAQKYFAERGYTEDPRRCRHCFAEYKRKRRKEDRRVVVDLPLDVDMDGPPFRYREDGYDDGTSASQPKIE